MRNLILFTTVAALVVGFPAAAQTDINGRVVRLESEMRAVQRKVFPGGTGQLLQPDVVAPVASTSVSGAPVGSAVVYLTARVTSLEQQMASMTGQIEQTSYQLRTLREQFETYKRSADTRISAASAAPVTRSVAPVDATEEEASRPVRRPTPAPRATTEAPVRTPAAVTRPAAAAASSTLERPSTGDPAEDSYLYGYRLWETKRYAEAQAALKRTVADYPKSRRASYAQNLLGRAYLDDGKPSLASMAFYDNYKKIPDGERAPDSLLYLGQALVKLNKPADACKVYDELNDVYGAKMSAGMKADVTRGRTAAKCK
jgi:TolA-binding protein